MTRYNFPFKNKLIVRRVIWFLSGQTFGALEVRNSKIWSTDWARPYITVRKKCFHGLFCTHGYACGNVRITRNKWRHETWTNTTREHIHGRVHRCCVTMSNNCSYTRSLCYFPKRTKKNPLTGLPHKIEHEHSIGNRHSSTFDAESLTPCWEADSRSQSSRRTPPARFDPTVPERRFLPVLTNWSH